MADNLTKKQRSYAMSRIRSSGNSSTEKALIRVMRKAGISGWRISETAMPCQADFCSLLPSVDKPLRTTSEWRAAGEAEAGSAGEQPAQE